MGTNPMKDSKEEFRSTARHKMPPITERDRTVVRRFLAHCMKQTEVQLKSTTEACRASPDVRIIGVANYLKARRSALRDLIAQNESRRGYGKADRTG